MVTLVVILLEVIREERLLSGTELSEQQKNQTDPLKEYSVIFTYRNQVATSGSAVFIQVVTQHWHTSNS